MIDYLIEVIPDFWIVQSKFFYSCISKFELHKQTCIIYTIVFTISEIWLEFLGDFGAKTGRFRRENMMENGPQLIRIVLCSNMHQNA